MKIFFAILLSMTFVLSFSSCEDDISSVYCTKYRVRCGFTVVNHSELVNCVNNLGQFSTVRMSGGKIIMKSSVSTTEYTPDYLAKDFYFGLGGLIIGTPLLPSDNEPLRAYDLACPNCDRAGYRLTVSDNARAKCAHCGITYDLNRDGMIEDKGSSNFTSPRTLYRYRIKYDGMMVHVYN